MITNTYLAIPHNERPRSHSGRTGITPRCQLSVLHNNGSLPGSTSYTVDAAGDRTSKTALQQGQAHSGSVTSNFSDDNIYPLTQAVVGGNVCYSFDAVGNRLTSLDPASYTYNSSNQLTATSSATYAYDSNGNTTSKSRPWATCSGGARKCRGARNLSRFDRGGGTRRPGPRLMVPG